LARPCLDQTLLTENRGFTLIETMIAAAVLACGLLAVASVFAFAVRANVSNRQMAIATALLYDKMEEFKVVSPGDPIWTDGDSSDEIVQDGVYLREWHINTAPPRSVTVIVYVQSNPLAHRQIELIRATALSSPTF
jgi:prepilin-type N-terminal cleavage/methylation domain-containing protein